MRLSRRGQVVGQALNYAERLDLGTNNYEIQVWSNSQHHIVNSKNRYLLVSIAVGFSIRFHPDHHTDRYDRT
jgi:hypothetical protein